MGVTAGRLSGIGKVTNPTDRRRRPVEQSTTPPLAFDDLACLAPDAAFDGGRLTSDGGLPWLAAADRALGVSAALAACVPEWRRGPARHPLELLVRQRLFQIACGYADQDDADSLRTDPLLKLACGRLPDSGPDLASQPTFSRLENAADRRAIERLAEALAGLYIRERGRDGAPARLLLDVDGAADPAHGAQEGVAYHGFHRQYMHHPLLVFDAATGQLVTALLRPGTCHGSRFLVLALRRLARRLRAAWPDVAMEVRADSGCAVPRLYAWCEAHDVGYTLGLVPNPRLAELAAPLLAAARAQRRAAGGAKVRLVGAAEALAKGPNTRFVVTTRTAPAQRVYDDYVALGAAENRIKDL
jgi:hypothetical protein